MLQMPGKTNIYEFEDIYKVDEKVNIYAKTIENKACTNRGTAIYIHGGGSGGNHTIVLRPSYWMLEKGIFSKIIMPDRRGAGNSSPIDKVMTYADNAWDMKKLLDRMSINEKITVIGISYGGPIALTLAGMDSRVERVILIASSPSLKPANGFIGFLYRKGLLDKLVKGVYKKTIGKLESQYADFDKSYEAKGDGDLKKIFLEAIKHMPKDRLDSLLMENASTCSLDNQAISKDIKISVPVYRVIGTKDETWEVDLGDTYKNQISDIKSSYIKDAAHKDVFFRAQEFYEALYSLVK